MLPRFRVSPFGQILHSKIRMIITCPHCSTRYPVKPGAFASGPRKVRCAKCGHSWDQQPLEEGGDAEAPSATPSAPADAAPVVGPAKPVFKREPEKDKSAGRTPRQINTTVAGAGPDNATGGRLRSFVHGAAAMRRVRFLTILGWITLLIFLGGTLGAGWVFRNEIASLWPATADVYELAGDKINLRGVEFHKVRYEKQEVNGLPVLAIMGEVSNVSDEPRALPRLRIGLRDEKQKEIYHWTFALPERRLMPDQSVPFVTRLSSPPPATRDVEIRFDKGSDLSPGGKAATVKEAPAAAKDMKADPDAASSGSGSDSE